MQKSRSRSSGQGQKNNNVSVLFELLVLNTLTCKLLFGKQMHLHDM